ncbi:hypothetical protein AB0A77_37905 [Streptomyces varsoviensis]|uniref:hypothetical protein n=1 Tax=Streptomyces varsoviensis TaxID=67373 RepID=UPI003410F09E
MDELVNLSYTNDWDVNSEISGQGDEVQRRIVETEEWVVRERWFIGSVSLRVGDALFEHVKTPLLDYSMSLRHALNALAADNRSTFSPTGGQEIQLSMESGSVELSRPGGDVTGISDFASLAKVAARFMREFIDEHTQAFPDLLLNGAIERIYRESGARELGEERFLRHSRAVRMRREMGRSF